MSVQLIPELYRLLPNTLTIGFTFFCILAFAVGAVFIQRYKVCRQIRVMRQFCYGWELIVMIYLNLIYNFQVCKTMRKNPRTTCSDSSLRKYYRNARRPRKYHSFCSG